jgi:hypothetical protein
MFCVLSLNRRHKNYVWTQRLRQKYHFEPGRLPSSSPSPPPPPPPIPPQTPTPPRNVWSPAAPASTARAALSFPTPPRWTTGRPETPPPPLSTPETMTAERSGRTKRSRRPPSSPNKSTASSKGRRTRCVCSLIRRSSSIARHLPPGGTTALQAVVPPPSSQNATVASPPPPWTNRHRRRRLRRRQRGVSQRGTRPGVPQFAARRVPGLNLRRRGTACGGDVRRWRARWRRAALLRDKRLHVEGGDEKICQKYYARTQLCRTWGDVLKISVFMTDIHIIGLKIGLKDINLCLYDRFFYVFVFLGMLHY